MHATIIVSVLSTILASAFAAQELKAPIQGYGVVDLSWDVEITPGGPRQIFNGTVQQVVAQLSKVNPNWEEDFKVSIASKKASTFAPRGLVKRDHFNCGNPWAPADYGRVIQGVDYLNGVPGQPGNGPGPGNCGRVSCSYKAAIWWCNDNSYSYTLSGFSAIAAGARIVADNCHSGSSTSGQWFSDNNWNVIVRYDDSNGC